MKKTMGVFSFGNKKLPRTTAIFNMTSVRDCPSLKLGMCQAIVKDKLGNDKCVCYSQVAERLYKNVLPYRDRQNDFWNECLARGRESGATDFVRELIKSRKPSNIKYLRFNESGDFQGQHDVYLVFMIAHKLWKHHGIVTYGYTARQDLDFTIFDS